METLSTVLATNNRMWSRHTIIGSEDEKVVGPNKEGEKRREKKMARLAVISWTE